METNLLTSTTQTGANVLLLAVGWGKSLALPRGGPEEEQGGGIWEWDRTTPWLALFPHLNEVLHWV